MTSLEVRVIMQIGIHVSKVHLRHLRKNPTDSIYGFVDTYCGAGLMRVQNVGYISIVLHGVLCVLPYIEYVLAVLCTMHMMYEFQQLPTIYRVSFLFSKGGMRIRSSICHVSE